MVQVEPCARSVQRQLVLPEAKNTQREPQRPQRFESVGRGVAASCCRPPPGILASFCTGTWHHKPATQRMVQVVEAAVPEAWRVAKVRAVTTPASIAPHRMLVEVPHGRRQVLEGLDGHRLRQTLPRDHVHNLVAP